MTTATLTHIPAPGSVSEGTHREADLIPKYLAVLETYAPERVEYLRGVYPKSMNYWLGDSILSFRLENEWLLESLYDELDKLAPEGHYFGAHPGDGADFGFWPSEESGDL